ncbi:MAG: hypothetical protein ACHRHE_06815 [Tepidisphaerales bacterium]
MRHMATRATALSSRIEVIDNAMADIVRRKTGAERLAIASGMYASARRMLVSHLRSIHSDWTDREVQLEASRRLSHGALGK